MAPMPADPRTPEKRVADQLAALRKKLCGPSLSRRERAEIADRIHELEQQAVMLASRFTLVYDTSHGAVEKENLRWEAVERIGAMAVRASARGDVWDIAVRDAEGADVTFNFACFS
ncbi:hypothetical protein [Streptomyces sp. NPDC004286]|uniref:hypothetical protein n=1 Tax=Streptomyces sp. NPDC004286 TaxID=3364696 RepID=UPI00369A15DB